ncbi:hypothetical protein [Methanobrevibacter sp. DSM 116169]|uniref:hypothetical protein n=1 Tax=Methanobrevibacter sp. DSM 116169 TaxID=3242727 RepID=UPI0038FC514B
MENTVYLKPNNDFIKKLSKDKIEKLVKLPEAIPSRIENMLNDNIPTFRDERLKVLDENLEDLEREERAKTRKMDPVIAAQFRNDLALEFITKYPEYKDIIEDIKKV